MSFPPYKGLSSDTPESSEPIASAAVQLHLRGEGAAALFSKTPPAPLRIRFFAQLSDGSTREWRDLTHMGQLILSLRELLGSSPPQQQYSDGGTLRIPCETAIADTAPALSSPRRDKSLRVLFFWMDVTGLPESHDLDDLFRILRVHPHTQRAWRADAARARAEHAINDDAASTSSARNNANDDPNENDSAMEHSFSFYDESSGAHALDQLHVHVAERYVHLLLAAIPRHSPPCASSSSSSSYLSPSHPDRLHANLFDVGDERELTRVRLLCFADGAVTWRAVPHVERWDRIFPRISATTALTTARLLHAILDELCAAFLPDPSAVLREVNAIDGMLSVIGSGESDRADLLRRVLGLRQRLSVHRRLLLGKVHLLDQLGRPVMRTILGFVTMDGNGRERKRCEVNEREKEREREKEAPMHTYAAIAQKILQLLRQIDIARMTLGNATMIHTSGISMRNNGMSNETDYRSLVLQYILIIVLPLIIIASQWGMNCWVPFQGLDSTWPFWIIFIFMVVYSVSFLTYPLYCWIKNKPHKLIF